jgi:hypothetical protein
MNLLIAFGTAFYAFNQQKIAKEATVKAEQKTEEAKMAQTKAEQAQHKSDSMLIQIQNQKGVILEEQSKTIKALAETEEQKKTAEEKTKEALAEKEKTKEALNAKIQADEEKRKADERLKAESKKNIQGKIDEINALKAKHPQDAKELLNDALKDFPNNPDLLKLKEELK